MKELEDEQSRTNASLKLEVTRLKEQLARSDARCLETKQALDSKSIEIHLMKERVRRIEGQLAKSEEEGTRLQEKILILEEEVSQLQADNMELQLQLELESNNLSFDNRRQSLKRIGSTRGQSGRHVWHTWKQN
jgi:chromosome segregation ATPase